MLPPSARLKPVASGGIIPSMVDNFVSPFSTRGGSRYSEMIRSSIKLCFDGQMELLIELGAISFRDGEMIFFLSSFSISQWFPIFPISAIFDRTARGNSAQLHETTYRWKFLRFRLAIFDLKLCSGMVFADSFHTQQSVITPSADCITDYNAVQNRL